MFSGICRQNTNKLPGIIFNLKQLFTNNSIEKIPSLYFSNKIEEQRTLHLKVLKLHSENKSSILKNLYLTNPTYNLMIKDLLKDFKNFNATEICDFLSWYRRSMAIGCLNVISQSEFDSISSTIKNLVINPNDFFPFKTTFYFNCGTLNLKNDKILDCLLQGTYNIKINDIKQILYIMNLNPEFKDPGLFEIIMTKISTAFNKLTTFSDYLKTYEYYIIYCKLNKIEPDTKVGKNFEDFFNSVLSVAPIRLIEIVNDQETPFIKQGLFKFHTKIIECSTKHLNNPRICLEQARFISTVFSEDTRKVKEVFDQAKYQFTQKKINNIPIQSKLLIDMTKTQYKDLKLADLCVETEMHPNEYKMNFLLNFVYYHEVTGRSLFEKLNLKNFDLSDIEKLCQELDFNYMIKILKTFIFSPCKTYNLELVQNWIYAEIIYRSKKDLQIARYYYMVCGLIARTYPNEVFRKLLIDLKLCISDSELNSKGA